MESKFRQYDDARREAITFQNTFDSNERVTTEAQRKLMRDRGTDLTGNSSLYEATNMGSLDKTVTVPSGSPDTGKVITNDDSVKINTPQLSTKISKPKIVQEPETSKIITPERNNVSVNDFTVSTPEPPKQKFSNTFPPTPPPIQPPPPVPVPPTPPAPPSKPPEDETTKVQINQKDESGNDITIDLTKSQDEIRKTHEAFVVFSREITDSCNDILQRIDDIKNSGTEVSDDVVSKLQVVNDSARKLNDIVEEINAKELKDVNLEEISERLTNGVNDVKKSIADLNFDETLEREFTDLLTNAARKVSDEKGEETKKFCERYFDDLKILANFDVSYFGTNVISGLVTVLEKARTAVTGFTEDAIVFGQTSEEVAKQVADSAESQKESAKTTEDIAKQNATVIKMLQEQYKESIRTFGDVEQVAKNFFSSVGGHISANVYDAISQISDAVHAQDFETVDELMNGAQGLSANMSVIVGLINELNSIPNEETTLDAHIATMTGLRKYVDSINSSQSNATKLFAELLSQAGNQEEIKKIIDKLQEETDKINEAAETVLDNGRTKLEGLIEQAAKVNEQKLKNANIAGTEEFNQSSLNISNMFAQSSIKNVKSSHADLANTMRHMTSSELQSDRTLIPGLYKYTTGNFLNRKAFKGSVANAQRTNIVAGEQLDYVQKNLETFRKSGDTKHTQGILEALAKTVEANAKAHLDGLKNVNLHRGQYKLLSDDDKGMLDSFLKSSDNAAASLRDAIAAIEAIDPQSKSLDTLKNINNELMRTTENIRDIKDDSFDVKDILSRAMAGVKKAHAMFVGGMGLMGLGMLAPTLGNVFKIISGGFEAEKRSGIYRYELARSDFAMGAPIDEARNNFYVNDMAREYYKLSQGQIGWDQVKNYAIAMRKNVGGHYGEGPASAKADMDKITEQTFGIAQVYGMNENDVSSFMKEYYKNLGHSVDQSSYALVRMARAAQAAGQPVSTYISNITSMMSSLREYGVEAEKIEQFMKDMVSGRGMRMEDASTLLSDTAHAGRNMGFNDWASSGFYGILAGQSADIFGNIVSGMMPVKSDGNVNDQYYSTMTQRLFTEAGLMGAMGGGPGSELGTALLMDDLSKRGYSQRSVSMLGDAYYNKDMTLFEELLKEADKEKEGNEEELKKAMSEAKDKIAASGNQVSEITKAQTSIAMAEKRLGEVIQTELKGPLESLRKGFDSLLNGFVSSVEMLIKTLKQFAESDTGKAIGNFMGSLSPMQMAGMAVGGVVGAKAVSKSVRVLAELGKYSITRNPAGMSTAAKAATGVVGALPGWGKLAALGLTAFAGVEAYQNIDKVKETQAYKDIVSAVGSFKDSIVNNLTSGEFKAWLTNGDDKNKQQKKAEENAQTKNIEENAKRQEQNETKNEEPKSETELEYEKSVEQLNETLKKEAEEQQKIADEYQELYKKNQEKAEEDQRNFAKSKTSKQTVEDIRKEDFKKAAEQDEKRYKSDTEGLSTVETIGLGTLGAAASAYMMNRTLAKTAPPPAPTPNSQSNIDSRRAAANKIIENRNKAMEALNNKHSQVMKDIDARRAQALQTPNTYNVNGRQIYIPSQAQDSAKKYIDAKFQKEIAEENKKFERQKQSISKQYATQSNTATEAEKAAQQSYKTGKLANMKNFMKVGGSSTAALNVVTSGIEEYMDYKKNPDKFTAGERAGRFAISSISSTAGMLLGGAVGSLAGPAGTVVGSMAGAYGGRLLGDQLKKIFKISDEDGKIMGDKYLDASKWASGKYTDDTNSLINSNDNRSRAAKENLEKHGVKMESLTKDQQRYIDDLFNQLKQLGYSDLSAAYLAGDQAGALHKKETEDTFNDKEKRIKALKEGEKQNAEHSGHYRTALRVFDDTDKEYGSADKVAKGTLRDLALQEKDMDWSTKDEMTVNKNKDKIKSFLSERFTDKEGAPLSDEYIDRAYQFVATVHEAKKKYKTKYVENEFSPDMDITAFVERNNKPEDKLYVDAGTGANWGNITLGDSAANLYDMTAKYAEITADAWGYNASEHYPQSILKEAKEEAEKEGKPPEEGIKKLVEGQAPDVQYDDSRIIKGGHAVLDNIENYTITSPYGMRMHPVYGVEKFHDGIDLAIKEGEENGENIRAIAGGTVTQSGWVDGYGYMTTVAHDNGTKSFYAHMAEQSPLEVGQQIEAGTLIGHVGDTGIGTGKHLHFGMEDAEGNSMDPTPYYQYGMTEDGKVGDGRAPTSDSNYIPSSSDGPNGNQEYNNDPESRAQKGFGDFSNAQKQLLEFAGKAGYSDKFATGRLIFDGTTASFRDSSVFMTPAGVLNRLTLSSGAQESSLMGFNQKGYFAWNGKEFEQMATSGKDYIEKKEKELREKKNWGSKTGEDTGKRWGERVYFDEEKLKHQDKAVLDKDAAWQESVERYKKPVEQRLEEDFGNDMDTKHSVNIQLNVVGTNQGTATKKWTMELIQKAIGIVSGQAADAIQGTYAAASGLAKSASSHE